MAQRGTTRSFSEIKTDLETLAGIHYEAEKTPSERQEIHRKAAPLMALLETENIIDDAGQYAVVRSGDPKGISQLPYAMDKFITPEYATTYMGALNALAAQDNSRDTYAVMTVPSAAARKPLSQEAIGSIGMYDKELAALRK